MIDTNKPISKVTYKGEELPMKGGYPEPTGSINITENGTYNVKDKAEAVVDIQGDSWKIMEEYMAGTIKYLKPSATFDEKNSLPTFWVSNVSRLRKCEFVSLKYDGSNVADASFRDSNTLKYLNIHKAERISSKNFWGTYVLKTIILTKLNSIATLENAAVFNDGDSMHKGLCTVYVPYSLLELYKNGTNWSSYSTHIKGFNESPIYDSSATYNIGDVCQYNGKFYGYSKEDLISSVGNAPSGTDQDNDYWEYVAEVNS